MIKVYYNKYQFQKGEEEGKKSVPGCTLHGEVKYVPGTNNKIVVGPEEEDKEDWNVFSGAMREYMEYFHNELLTRVEENKKASYAEGNALLEDNFIVVQK